MGRIRKIHTDLVPLTMENVASTFGKCIEIIYDNGTTETHDEFVVGGLKSKYDLAKEEIMYNGLTRAQNYERDATPKNLQAIKNTMCLLDSNGTNTFIQTKNGKFVSQDNGRQVFFKIK